MLHFEHPNYLFALLIVIPLLIVVFKLILSKKDKAAKKIGNIVLVQLLTANFSQKKFTIKYFLLVGVIAISIITLANLRHPNGNSLIKKTGVDVMIALDVSKSMLAKDIEPNRLERAKQQINKLIDLLPNDRIGLVVFGGKAYMQMPLTADHAAAKMYVNAASTDIISTQGTVIGDALKVCNAAFNPLEKKYKSIVLISDGEDHDETAEQTATALANQGVIINTIGIGSNTGANIFDEILNEPKKDNDGNIIVTKLNETTLKKIAESSNGIYQSLNNGATVNKNITALLQSFDKKAITEKAAIQYQYYFQWFVAAMIMLLLLESFISEIKNSTFSNKSIAILTCILLICSVQGFSQSQTDLVATGNELYNKKEFNKAIETYNKALEKNPTNFDATHNIGNAHYKNNQIPEALAAYSKAIQLAKTPNQKSAAWYNKGVVLQNNKQLQECIDAYKNALRLNPSDNDARLNLQKAIQQQQKQQQKENNKNEPKKQQPQKQQQQKPQNKPTPTPNKMTKNEAEEKLKALSEKEKNLQDKFNKKEDANNSKLEKDW